MQEHTPIGYVFAVRKLVLKLIFRVQLKIHNAWLFSAGIRFRVEPNVYFKLVSDTASLTFGDYVFIGKGCEFDVQEEIAVGSNVLIAPGAFITDHNHGISADLRINQQACVPDRVSIGDDVWIGANAVILPGVTLSTGAVVGAGAVVTNDVAPMTIVAGVPAKPIGKRTLEPKS